MNEIGMQILHSRKLLRDLKQISLEFYEIFVYKKKRVRFLRVGNVNKSEQLELRHIDVWGPDEVQSLNDSHYYVTLIDNATRKTQVYCIRHKSGVFSTFKNQKHLVENQTWKKLKFLIFQNGGEYCSKEFDSYYLYNASHIGKIVHGTPQENGVL